MSLLVFEHHPAEGPAVLGSILNSGYGRCLNHVKLYAGDPVPTKLDGVNGIVSMGGPMNVDQVDPHPWIEKEMRYLKVAHEAGVPVVGVCLGAQLIAAALGGIVASMAQPEIGWHAVDLAFGGTVDPVFAGQGWQGVQFHLHGQEVAKLPPGGVALAASQHCRNQAFRVGLTTYGFQYHFEWNRQDLAEMVRDPFVVRCGHLPEQILGQSDRYYEDYRRLGDRLCHMIAMTLLPMGKR